MWFRSRNTVKRANERANKKWNQVNSHSLALKCWSVLKLRRFETEQSWVNAISTQTRRFEAAAAAAHWMRVEWNISIRSHATFICHSYKQPIDKRYAFLFWRTHFSLLSISLFHRMPQQTFSPPIQIHTQSLCILSIFVFQIKGIKLTKHLFTFLLRSFLNGILGVCIT